jgi:bis(5'-nucleosidyl)-tetraphosphatase
METVINFFYKSLIIFLTRKDYSFGIVSFYDQGKDREYLVLQFSFTNRWGFPKGHAKIGEGEIPAARRELKEEAGIANCHLVDGFLVKQQYSFRMLGFWPVAKTVKYFVGQVGNKKVKLQPREAKDYKWLNFQQAEELLSKDSAKEVLRKVEEKLNGLR